MRPAALGVSCREALGVFAQYETLRLQRRVRELERENHALRRPSLYTCMRNFNEAHGPCFCLACLVGGRALRRDPRYAAWVAGDSRECLFQAQWEAYLAAIGGSTSEEQSRETCFYNYNADWVYSGYGGRLSSLDSPRRAVWDRLREDYGGDGDPVIGAGDEDIGHGEEQPWPAGDAEDEEWP
jgi:hypothetical protein